jgi:serine-aspartate repeat-containing protein C/D/E
MSLLALLTDAARSRTTHTRSKRNVRQRRSMPELERLESLQLLSGYTYDFSGYKFEDKNQNGQFDYGYEKGLKGWDIRAYEDSNHNYKLDQSEYDDGPAKEAWTDYKGYYDLKLDKGSYIIVEVQQDGWDQTAPYKKVLSYNLDTSYNDETLGPYGFAAYVNSDSDYNNFGNHKQEKPKVGTVSGSKFNDLAADGVNDDTDPGLAGWQIRAFRDLNGNGLIDYNYEATSANVAASTTTDANGDYTLSLEPGKYVIVETTKGHPGWFQSYPTNDVLAPHVSNVGHGGYALTIHAGDHLTGKDFGNYQNATITGTKFEDKNHNGYQDSYEKGLYGWTIEAFADTDGNGKLSQKEFKAGPADTDTTDYDGDYSLSVKPGHYIIVEVLQKNWKQSELDDQHQVLENYGYFDHLGQYGYSIIVTSGKTYSGNDFGNYYKKKDGNGYWA